MSRFLSLLASLLLVKSVLAAAPASGGAPGGSSSGGAPAQGGAPAYSGPTAADFENEKLVKYTVYIWVAIIGTILIHRLLLLGLGHVRKIACLANEKQQYFARVNSRYAAFRKHFLEAPLISTRHNREFMLSSAINVGTLPLRLQTLLIAGYFGVNVAFCVLWLPYSGKSSTLLTDLRNRSGTLSVMNMIPLFLMAGRNNFLIWMLDISFDTYNLCHRWLGRIAVIEAIVHTAAYCTNKVNTSGMQALLKSMASSPTILTGTIGTAAFIFLILHSPSIVRHAYYEVFLHLHIAVALVSVVVLWMHLDEAPFSRKLLLAAIITWGIERFIRVQNLIRNNVGSGGTSAEVEAMPGDALRVTLRMARPWKFQPGQHVFLYMPTIGWWTNHPFSLAWSDEYQDVYNEKSGLPVMERQDIMAIRKTTMSLIIRRRTGFTDKLWTRAENSPDGRFVTTAFVEGPYGAQNLDSYGTVMLFAAGVGITHQVPFLRELVQGYSNGTSATRRVTLVWIIQSPEHLEWIRPWMTDILGMEKRRDVLKILLFITRPRSTKEIHSPSSSVQMFPGKPDVDALVAQLQQAQVGAMAVSVCGTGSLSDDVRRAVRNRCQKTSIDFVENAFSW